MTFMHWVIKTKTQMECLYATVDKLMENKLKEASEKYDVKMQKAKERAAMKAQLAPTDTLEYNVKKVISKINETDALRRKQKA